MAANFALLALPGAFISSVGALVDSFALTQIRVERMFSGPDQIRMETRLRILSFNGEAVPLNEGLSLSTQDIFEEQEPFAFIWIPSFRAQGVDEMAQRLSELRPVLDWLVSQKNQGAIIGASGAASLLLMAGGLTTDIAVPASRGLQPLSRALFPRQKLEDRFGLIDHGNMLISSGIAHDLALVLKVIDRTISPDVARWLTSITGLNREEDSLLATDPMIARAQLWIEQHYAGTVSMAALANYVSTSPATLNRRFRKALGMSPGAYVNQLRFQSAIRMLEKSTRSIDVIAQLLGYSDSRLFRAMFRQHAGMTASQWREKARKERTQNP